MALDARTRSSLYAKFAELVGDDDANALMSQFPSIEADELVTKQFLRAELAVTRGELRAEMGDLRMELRAEMGDLRTELRAEIAGLRGEMAERFHRQTAWLAGTVLGSSSVVVAALALFV